MTDLSPVEIAMPVPRAGVDRVGIVALVVGTAIIAWSGVLARFLDVGPLAGAAWRMGLAVPALAAWARVLQRGRTSSPALRPAAGLLILAGLAFALDVGSFHISLSGTKVANATFIGNVAPILTVVGGALFFREQPSGRVWLALALALVGAWVMAGMAAPMQVGYGDAFALSAAIAYASYLLIIKQLRVRLDAATATLWSGGGFSDPSRRRRLAARRDDDPLERVRLDDRCAARLRHARDGTRVDLGGDGPRAGQPHRVGAPRSAAVFGAHRLARARRGDDAAADRGRRAHPRRRRAFAPWRRPRPPRRAERSAASMTRTSTATPTRLHFGRRYGPRNPVTRAGVGKCRV
jgi:uncharacterized membrane protein